MLQWMAARSKKGLGFLNQELEKEGNAERYLVKEGRNGATY